MKVNAIKFFNSLFIIVLFLQLYLPSFKANIFIQIGVLIFFFQFEKLTATRSFLKWSIPLAALFVIGFIGFFIHKYLLFNVLKDIFHFLKPLLGIAIGYYFYKRINDFELFIKTIVIAGFISAIIHLGIIFFFSKTETVAQVREFGKDNFLELFGLFLMGYYRKFEKADLFSKLHYRIIFVVLLFSNIIYFSRTMLVVAVLLWLSIEGYTRITPRTVKIIAAVLISVIALYAYLFSIKIDRSGKGAESFLYKVKIAPEELFKTKIDRENHADLWDHWRGYEAKRAVALMDDSPSSYVFGCGYGSLVNLKFYAPLSVDGKGMRYISELHNGYAYILYKTGILGILIYLGYLLRLYRKINVEANSLPVLVISGIGLIYVFTTLTITGLYNTRDVIVFILGAMLFFEKRYAKAQV